MVQSLETLIVTLVVTIVIFVALFFLPAIIELKKPKDAGPRVIIDFGQICLSDLKTSLQNVEEDLNFDSQLTSKIGVFLRFIPNLEA
jgi:uncharacterized membrane protein YcaP (DUF421 family)